MHFSLSNSYPRYILAALLQHAAGWGARWVLRAVILSLTTLLVLAPVLHAHRGASLEQGWHWHTPSVAAQDTPLHLPNVQAADSAEVDVPPLKLSDDTLPLPVLCFLLLFSLALAAATPRPCAPLAQRTRHPAVLPHSVWRLANSAPPTLAPPHSLAAL